jgi:hypothetical protein
VGKRALDGYRSDPWSMMGRGERQYEREKKAWIISLRDIGKTCIYNGGEGEGKERGRRG